jgi:hypothetical protein
MFLCVNNTVILMLWQLVNILTIVLLEGQATPRKLDTSVFEFRNSKLSNMGYSTA